MSTPFVKSLSDRLKRLAQARNAAYAEVLTQFLIERAALRLVSDPELYDALVFKGGFVGLAVYGSPRFTTDLDAVLRNHNQGDARSRILSTMTKDLGDHVWFDFEKEVDLVTQNEYGGIRFQYRAGLGSPPADKKRAQIVHIDIGTGDPITPGAVAEHTPSSIGIGEISWNVYPIETIIAEKLHPLAVLGAANSRSKDIFDLAFYLPKAKPDLMRDAIARTFSYRGHEVPGNFSALLEALDTTLLKRGWKSATGSIKAEADFDATYRILVEWLKKWGF